MTNPFDPEFSYKAKPIPAKQENHSRDLIWYIGLGAITLFSSFIYLWKLAAGARSEYYAAIAVSMSKSISNFIFGALDPAGTVSLDKIPGSYWIPALFVKIFGFSTWAVNAPNAIAGVATAIVVAFTVRRFWGTYPAIFAGFAISTTPIFTAVSRSNQAQTFFVLALALAADRASVALKTGSRRSLIWSGIWIGVAFQTWMLPAWAIWPALIAAWLIAAPVGWNDRIKSLLIAGGTSLVVSLSWIILVTFTPASARPYIGGTYHNNAWEMVFGYNGLGRFSSTSGLSDASDDPIFRTFTPPFGGEAGIGRLFSTQLAGQIAWLFPLVLISILLFIAIAAKNKSIKKISGNFLFAALWFTTQFIMFSSVAGMHQFYVASMAIPIVLLIAEAANYLISRADQIARYVAAIAILVTALWGIYISNLYKNFMTWTSTLQLVIAIAFITVILVNKSLSIKYLAFLLVLPATLLAPAAWSADVMNSPNSINPAAGPDTGFGGGNGFRQQMGGGNQWGQGAHMPPTFSNNNLGQRPNFGNNPRFNGDRKFDPNNVNPGGGFGNFPNGGLQMPDTATGINPNQPNSVQPNSTLPFSARGGNGFGAMQMANKELITYLKQNRDGAKFLFATFGAQSAAPYITSTGENVLPIGGFDGQDPSPTLAQFKKLISTGQLKYVLNGSGGRGGENSNNEIQSWVTTNCSLDSNAPAEIYLCSVK